MVQSRGHAAAEITDFFFFKDTLFHVAAAGCEKDLVVLAQGGQEDEGGDVFKAVDPLPTLRLLTAHVHNPVGGRRTRGQDE